VQRIVNDLHRDGLVTFEPNPHHRRAQLVVMTDKGSRALAAAMNLQTPWVNHLTEGPTVDDVGLVRRIVAGLRERLEQGREADDAHVP
jgi:DNA-binding MarR family transcriptional regulator